VAHVINWLGYRDFSYGKKKEYPADRMDSSRTDDYWSAEITEISGRKYKNGICNQLARLGRFFIWQEERMIPQIAWIQAEQTIIGLRKSPKSAGGNKNGNVINPLDNEIFI